MPARKILIVCFDNIGDLLFCSALLPPLRESFPDARLGLWCKQYTAPLAPLIPELDEIFASEPFWDRSPQRSKGRFLPFARAILRVRAAGYDCAIIPSLRWQAAAAALAAGIPERIGMAGRRNRRWLTTCLDARNRNVPVMKDSARLLEPMGIRAQGLSYALSPERLPRSPAHAARRIVLHPFAGSVARCLPSDVWLRFSDELRRSGWEISWCGTAAELHELRLQPGVSQHDHFPASDDLLASVALIGAADVFAGHDSGPMHIASALGIPTIGVFAPGEPQRTFPQGRAPYVLVSAPSPLTIGPEDLLSALSDLTASSDRVLHI